MQSSEEDIAWFRSSFHPVPNPAIPEDCIEYTIYLLSTGPVLDSDYELRLQLREVQKHAEILHKEWLKGYIWQRQDFSLELAKQDGHSYLTGRTVFGDSIEDEWVIMWLLRELTQKFSNAWVKVTDSDGEFLLIEASGTIPRWLEPEVAENRVWINNGQLKILRPAKSVRFSKHIDEKLSIQDAIHIIMKEPGRIMHLRSIEEAAFYRLRNYPGQIQNNMHHAMVTVPRKVAFLLLQKPAYIAPAIEAFYLRDPIALKLLRKVDSDSSLRFPPKDLVTISIKFPKVGYAQIRSQEFPVLPGWKTLIPSHSEAEGYNRTSIGMKVTCGFEMLLSDSHHQDEAAVREMNMILDDLRTGDETLPSDVDIGKLSSREDDEKWLDINFDDLEHELKARGHDEDDGKKRDFGDKAAQENLQRIVKQFESFLNEAEDSSDLDEDDEDDSDSGEDKEASFDENQFTRMMQEMMGMPPDVMKEIMSGTIDALSKDRSGAVPQTVRERAQAKVQEVDSSDEDGEEMRRMEAELRASGVLDLGSDVQKGKKSIRQTPSRQQENDSADVEDSEDDQGLNEFDEDFARNILQSFRSSGGMGGPAANLMNMMNATASSSRSGESKRQKRS